MKNTSTFQSLTISFLIFASTLLLMLQSNGSFAQSDSVSFKNTVRINLTNPMIFGDKAIIFGYERLLKNNHSFSINVGRAFFPELLSISVPDSSGVELQEDQNDFGINLSADYRIYLKKENKYPAPRGVYFAPFSSYNYFTRTNNWVLSTENFQGNLQTDFKFNVFTAGVELGYQFVFWDRIAVDMILLGPGVSFYNFKVGLSTDLDPEEESEIFQIIGDYLSEKIPGFDQTIDDGDFSTTGSVKTTTLGFRYMIMLGYRF